MQSEVSITTSDGIELEAELFLPASPQAAVLIAHPNPLMGGDMHTPVPAALWRTLPELGLAGLRFNFRGVGRSGGTHDKGRGEQLDVTAAIDALMTGTGDVSLILSGWSQHHGRQNIGGSKALRGRRQRPDSPATGHS